MSQTFSLSQIGQIAITVHDLERAVAFYRDRLGLPLLFQFPGLAFFDCHGVRLLLETAAEDGPRRNSILYYRVADIQAAYKALQQQGVAFIEAPNRVARMSDHDLWMAFFQDPDENILAIMSEVSYA
ncbi:MAG: VOC family protein [Anaerolineales bacterium]|nr:VOC family protein [Anaerolineales bacterium]